MTEVSIPGGQATLLQAIIQEYRFFPSYFSAIPQEINLIWSQEQVTENFSSHPFWNIAFVKYKK